MKTLLIDTNVLLRFMLNDIPDQYDQAAAWMGEIEIGKTKGIISLLVVNELIWIMETFYNAKRKEYMPKIIRILIMKNITILETKKSFLFDVLKHLEKSSLDFTDIYLAASKNRHALCSFDKALMRYTYSSL